LPRGNAEADLELAAQRAAEELQRARAQASEIVSQAEKARSGVVREAKSAAKAEADRIVAAAKQRIEQEVSAPGVVRATISLLAGTAPKRSSSARWNAKAHAHCCPAPSPKSGNAAWPNSQPCQALRGGSVPPCKEGTHWHLVGKAGIHRPV